MIKTVPLDFIANLMVGMSIALLAARHIEKDRLPVVNRYLLYPVAFEALVFGPIGLYLILAYGDWSGMYFINLSATSGWIRGVVVLFIYTAAIIAGYIIAHGWILNGKGSLINAALIAGGVLIALISILLWNRLSHVGTVGEFNESKAAVIFCHPIMALLVALGPMFASAYILMAMRITKEVRKAVEFQEPPKPA